MRSASAGTPTTDMRTKLAKHIAQEDTDQAALPPPFIDNPGEMLELAFDAVTELFPPQQEIDAARAQNARTHHAIWMPPANGYLRQVTPSQWKWQVANEVNVRLHDLKFQQFNADWRVTAVEVSEGWRTYKEPVEVGKDPVTLEPQIQYRRWRERHVMVLYELTDMKATSPIKYGPDSMPLDVQPTASMSPELVNLFALMNAKTEDAETRADDAEKARLEVENQALQDRLGRLERMMEMQMLTASNPVVVQQPAPAPEPKPAAAPSTTQALRDSILDDDQDDPPAAQPVPKASTTRRATATRRTPRKKPAGK